MLKPAPGSRARHIPAGFQTPRAAREVQGQMGEDQTGSQNRASVPTLFFLWDPAPVRDGPDSHSAQREPGGEERKVTD